MADSQNSANSVRVPSSRRCVVCSVSVLCSIRHSLPSLPFPYSPVPRCALSVSELVLVWLLFSGVGVGQTWMIGFPWCKMVYPRTRVRVIRMFVNVGKLPIDMAIAMDECIISLCPENGAYTREATRVCHNIVHNPQLAEIEPRALCSMSNAETRAPELQRHIDDEAAMACMVQSMLKEKYASVSANTTVALRCRVCKGSDVSFQQKQTRGADEAMTIFCICVCGARWKMS